MRKYLFATSAPLALTGAFAFLPEEPGPPAEIAATPVETFRVGEGDPAGPCLVQMEVTADIREKLIEMGIEDWAAACRKALADDAGASQ